MGILYGVASSLVMAVLLAALVRRVLGVPVGWPRSILVGLGITTVSIPLISYVLQRSGLMKDTGFEGTPGEAVAYLIIPIAWVFALGLAALVIAEVVIPTGSLPTIFSVMSGWGPFRRRHRRYARILFIAVRHGLGRFLRIGGNLRRDGLVGRQVTARSLRHALNDGGVTFVKLGQMLSTRRDLLPEEFVVELSQLQSRAEALPWTAIEPVINAELGRPISDVFARVSSEPLAAASVGQVHEAELIEGGAVVIKVQRPNAVQQVDADLDIMARLAERLERVAPWAKAIGLRRLVAGFADSLHEELDYRVEMDNVLNVQSSLEARPDSIVEIPRIHAALTTRRLLVMDKLDGVPLDRGSAVLEELGAERRQDIAGKIVAEILRQILVTGVFHADLHPGNIFVRADGTLALLDFGSVGRLDSSSRTALGLLLLAVDRDDAIGATNSLVQLLDRPDDLSERDLERDVGQLMVRYRGGLGSQGSAGMFGGLMKMISHHKFAVPPQVGAALRALGALEGTVRMISPAVDLVSAARSEGKAFMAEMADSSSVRDRLEGELIKVLPLLQRMPLRLNRLTDDLENGRLTVNVRAFADRRDRQYLTNLVNQVTVAIIATAVTLGGILLLTSEGGPPIALGLHLYPVFGYALLFVGFVLGLRVLVLAFRRAWSDPVP